MFRPVGEWSMPHANSRTTAPCCFFSPKPSFSHAHTTRGTSTLGPLRFRRGQSWSWGTTNRSPPEPWLTSGATGRATLIGLPHHTNSRPRAGPAGSSTTTHHHHPRPSRCEGPSLHALPPPTDVPRAYAPAATPLSKAPRGRPGTYRAPPLAAVRARLEPPACPTPTSVPL